MKIGIYQFNGCQKCFDQTILIKDAIRVSRPSEKTITNYDIAVITGYLTPQDLDNLNLIKEKSKKVIAFGSCAVSGGVFGLAYQKGINIRPIDKLICDSSKIEGCMLK
jgi:coenzyme F420-reducing hydrogenase gamma subunit